MLPVHVLLNTLPSIIYSEKGNKQKNELTSERIAPGAYCTCNSFCKTQ